MSPRKVDIGWLESRIAALWPLSDTAELALRIVVQEAVVANALAAMRDRDDPRLRHVPKVPGGWTHPGACARLPSL